MNITLSSFYVGYKPYKYFIHNNFVQSSTKFNESASPSEPGLGPCQGLAGAGRARYEQVEGTWIDGSRKSASMSVLPGLAEVPCYRMGRMQGNALNREQNSKGGKGNANSAVSALDPRNWAGH